MMHLRNNLNFVKLDTKNEIFKRVTLAKEFINNEYDRKFYLTDVASASFLSVNHLLRTFKQAFGLSPYQYLTLIRLTRAQELLISDTCSVNEIVLLVGFESTSSFIKAFKSQFNTTPLKYRKLSTWN